MAAIQPPLYIQAGTYPASVDGIALASWMMHDDVAQKVREGVIYNNETSLQCTATGSTLQVTIADGRAVLDNGLGGAYICTNRGLVNMLIGSTSGTARNDIIGVRVRDAEKGVAGGDWQFVVITGTPGLGDPALLSYFVPLCRVRMPATAPLVLPGYVEDMRTFTAPAGGVVVASSTTRPATTKSPLGQIVYERDTKRWTGFSGAGYTTVGEYVLPGTIVAYAGAAGDPTGWLLCDGRNIFNRVAYASLYAAIGTVYGVGDGSTTFGIPNLKGKFIVGVDTTNAIMNVVGETGGEQFHSLSVAELPEHKHDINHDHAVVTSSTTPHSHAINHGHITTGSSDISANHHHDYTHGHGRAYGASYGGAGSHQHSIPATGTAQRATGATGSWADSGSFRATDWGGGHDHNVYTDVPNGGGQSGWADSGHSHTTTIATSTGLVTPTDGTHTHTVDVLPLGVTDSGLTGSVVGPGNQHNNMPPFMALNYLIHI
jgi:microcystin-dependent protein